MPYEISLTKRVAVMDRDQYFNECCIGGDAVVDHLLPSVRSRYDDVQTNQEDWGWFIWFRKDQIRLAIDVFTEDSEQGLFRIHLTSRIKRLIFFDTVVDTVELEELRTMVETELKAWGGTIKVDRLDRNYM
jgi:hypothetical protein